MADSEKYKLYNRLLAEHGKAYSDKKKDTIQKQVKSFWDELKEKHLKFEELEDACNRKIEELRRIELKRKGMIFNMWPKSAKNSVGSDTSKEDCTVNSSAIPSPTASIPSTPPTGDGTQSSSADSVVSKKAKYTTPTQDLLREQINQENDLLVSLHKKKSLGMLSEFDGKELMVRESQVDDLKKKLKKCEQDQARQKKARDTRKKKLESLDEESRVLLTGKKDCTPGRPPKEDNNAIIDAICRIAISGSAAHEKRRSDIIRTVKTLDQLTSALKLEGFTLQRSSVYLRLLPRIAQTIEGKRHVNTAPVKLLRSQNSIHKGHPSTRFAKSTIRHLEELAGILGTEEMCFLSQDDKCKVPIGLTAANKQAPLLMHLEYQVTLPDHDYVIAANHKLIPSVIGEMEIKKNCFTSEAVTYSGPTYIGTRSAKHSGSNAYHHLHDLKKIRMIPEFEPLL